jgi:glutamate racemase
VEIAPPEKTHGAIAAASGARQQRLVQILGLFDSGLGGLTVLRSVRASLPDADLLYLADQGRVPYGDRSDAELQRFLSENAAFLEASGADAIVMGCNTTCAVARQHGWPLAAVPVLDLIESAALAVAATGVKRIGVIATRATIRSGAYGNALRELIDGARVTEIAAPALVPLVEAGRLDGEEPFRAVAHACGDFEPDLEALVLACTHYPLLDAHFARVFGAGVVRVDPALVQARRACALPEARLPGRGTTTLVTSGEPAAFERAVRALVPSAELGAATFAAWTPALATP